MVLELIERYYDGAPRSHADVHEVGGFTVFVGRPGGWTFAARPRLGDTAEYDAVAVGALLARMKELEVPPALEWVHETTPSLRDAVLAEGSLEVDETPLMVLGGRRPDGVPVASPDGVLVRMIGRDDDDAFEASNAVPRVAFDDTSADDAGARARDAARRAPSPQALELLRAGAARVAVAEHPEHGVLAAGRHIERDGVTEVVGVATLPAFRRRGLAAAVTEVLIDDALERGCGTVFLTASSPAVAALYGRLGFELIGTGYVAES